MKTFSTFLKGLGRNLTYLDDQPIGKAAFTVVLILDFFILFSIFDGLAVHTRQLTSPEELIPGYCREIVINGEWNATNRLWRLANLAENNRWRYQQADRMDRGIERHPGCADFTRLLESILQDDALMQSLQEFDQVRNQIRQTRGELEQVKGAYDTSLLRDIAQTEQPEGTTNNLADDVTINTGGIDRLVRRQSVTRDLLEGSTSIAGLFEMIGKVTPLQRSDLTDELRRLNFWYPAKRLGMEMMFLIPLILVFIVWNSKSIVAHRPFQTLISAHLLIVAFIPALLKTGDLLYEIIPRRFLRQLTDFLEAMNLVALWHYLMMTVAIISALGLLYVLQKKLFSPAKLIKKRISKGLCQDCGVHLQPGSLACSACGFVQFRTCSQCGEPTYIHGAYCRHCGSAGS